MTGFADSAAAASLRAPAAFTAVAVLAGVLAACGGDATAPPPVDLDVVEVSASGRVFTLDGAVPGGLRAIIRGSSGAASAPIAPDGTFSVTAEVVTGTWDLIIDVESGTRTLLPSLLRSSTGMPQQHGVTMLLVPRQWQISGGTYAGQNVEVSLDAAFRAPCSTAGDTNCDGYYPDAWRTGIKLWPEDALPIRVAFDRTRTTQPITAADSSAFWQIVQRMNDDYGRPLFRPAREQDIAVNAAGTPNGGILVRVDTTITGFGAWTNWWWNGAGQMYAGVVRPRLASFLSNSSLMSHEMLHTHGFKHSCAWGTVMGGYGCSSVTRLSPQDVAYAQLAVQVAAALRTTGALHGLYAARDGERVVLRGLAPIGTTVNARLLFMRGDSIGEPGSDHAH